MDEIRDGLGRIGAGLRKVLEVLMMSDTKTITFGDILDLLERDETMVTLYYHEDNLTGSACCCLWEPLEVRAVESIGVDDGGLNVWLGDEDDGEA